MIRLGLSVGAGILYSALAIAGDGLAHFQYRARVPAAEETCQGSAQALAHRMAQSQAGLTNLRGRCLAEIIFEDHGERFGLHSLVVEYDAKAKAEFHREEIRLEHGYGDQALYPAYRDCLAEVAEQSTIFTRLTGLSLWAVYCAPRGDADFGYSLVLEASGEPKARLHQAVDRTGRSPQDRSWAERIREILMRAGGEVIKQKGNVHLYYAGEEVGFTSVTLARLDSEAHCLEQSAEAQSMFERLGGRQIATACRLQGFGGVNLDVLADVGSANLHSNPGGGAELYFTYAECMVNRDFPGAGAHQTFGAFCVPDLFNRGRYRIQTFEKW